jgi:hypothetical protein
MPHLLIVFSILCLFIYSDNFAVWPNLCTSLVAIQPLFVAYLFRMSDTILQFRPFSLSHLAFI